MKLSLEFKDTDCCLGAQGNQDLFNKILNCRVSNPTKTDRGKNRKYE